MTLVTLEPTVPASADLLAALHAAAFAEAWPASAFAGLLQIPGTFALVLDGTPEPRGFVVARVVAGEAEIITLGVPPAARRGGEGRRLVQAACTRARADGARTIFLEVAAGNAAARALYARFGFIEVGRRKGYYTVAGAPPDDALVLRADLGSGPGPALDDDGVNL